jgi:hypothetical protein
LKGSTISATITGYLDFFNDEFETAMGKFALECADQAERDYAKNSSSTRQAQTGPITQTCGAAMFALDT